MGEWQDNKQDEGMEGGIVSSLNGYREVIEELLVDNQPDEWTIFKRSRVKTS